MSTRYHIIQRNSFNVVTESGGSVTDASPGIDWSIGLPFGYVRLYAERKGWKIVPIIENQLELKTFEYDGSTYELYHDGVNIKQIMKNNREISWDALPSVLKGLL